MNPLKFYFVIPIFLIIACKAKVTTEVETENSDTISVDNTRTDTVYTDTIGVTPHFYSNARFKDVAVEKTGDNTYRITGKGQIFEANFGWVIEDGHNELQTGHQMTDAGAPEWGNFDFTVNLATREPNRTYHLILFESSPKDGSRQYELPILLD